MGIGATVVTLAVVAVAAFVGGVWHRGRRGKNRTPGRDALKQKNSEGAVGGDLRAYGGCIAVYEGNGVLMTEGGKGQLVRFEAGQVSDGSVFLLCNTETADPTLLFESQLAVSFRGTTTNGYEVVTNGALYPTNWLPERQGSETGLPRLQLAYRVQQLTVTCASCPAVESRFALTNLTLCNNEMELRIPSGPSGGEGYPGCRVRLRQVPDYVRRVRVLRTLKNVDVTCEAILDDGHQSRLRPTEVLDDVSYVLSVARGTKVNWVDRRDYDAEGRVVRHIASGRVTKPYNGLAIIDPRVDEETRSYVSMVLPRYREQRDALRLAKGVIDSYLDAKAASDYLEMRAAKMAVALEMLKTAYSAYLGWGEFIVEETKFEGLVPSMQEAIAEVLRRNSTGKEDVAAIASEGKVKALNRRSFRHLVYKLLKQTRLSVPDLDLKRVIASRNKLVHTGYFYCQAATAEELAECPAVPGPTEEYFFLVNFLDKVFLKLLGYSGTYIDWSAPGNPQRAVLD